jgi:hypothetical protein
MDISDRIGAWMTGAGCFFRVWAPNARRVGVLVQDGPYWEDGDEIVKQDLVRRGDFWSRTVPGLRPWKIYRFGITSGTDVFQTLDPAARDVVHSGLTRRDPASRNASIIAEDDLVDWDRRHRYFVDQLGGREDWTARGRTRLAWALNVAMPGTADAVHGLGMPHGLAARVVGVLDRRRGLPRRSSIQLGHRRRSDRDGNAPPGRGGKRRALAEPGLARRFADRYP